MDVGDSQNEQPSATKVESVDSSEQSIDEQLVQLAQAKLDGTLDQETYERLVGLVKELLPPGDWNQSKSIEYATPRRKTSTEQPISKNVLVLGITLILVFIAWFFQNKNPTSRSPQALDTATKTDIFQPLRLPLTRSESIMADTRLRPKAWPLSFNRLPISHRHGVVRM